MTPIRERAKEILDAMPATPIRSNDHTGNYKKFTGIDHETLESNWKTGGIMTGCNGFVGWYGRQVGATVNLGRFDLTTYLPSIGKGHAWVKSTADRRPSYGDILLHAGLHEDVALGFDGDILNRMAAGQGGRSQGCDILTRVRGKSVYSYINLQGWIDLDLYFGATQPVLANQLLGWWSVWDGNQYYYFFDAKGGVQYTTTKPLNTGAPLKLPLNQGSYAFASSGKLVIDWNPADGGATKETFTWPPLGERINGISNRYAPLVATKMK